MRSMLMPFLALVAMTCPPVLGGESKVTKLQIGVKKRIPADECTIKSRKGDKLSMHYTVKYTLFRQLLSTSKGLEKWHGTSIQHKRVTFCLQGKLEDGTEFDSSIPRGSPLDFTLGMGQVIKGWDQGLMGMCQGEKRKLSIPPHLVRRLTFCSLVD